MLKLIVLGATGYAAYRFLGKTGRLPSQADLAGYVDALKDKAGLAKFEPTRTQA